MRLQDFRKSTLVPLIFDYPLIPPLVTTHNVRYPHPLNRPHRNKQKNILLFRINSFFCLLCRIKIGFGWLIGKILKPQILKPSFSEQSRQSPHIEVYISTYYLKAWACLLFANLVGLCGYLRICGHRRLTFFLCIPTTPQLIFITWLNSFLWIGKRIRKERIFNFIWKGTDFS